MADQTKPWELVDDDELVERLIREMQKGTRMALTGSAEPTSDVGLPLPEAATALLNLLASVLEPMPACSTPQGMRKVGEAAGKELAILIRGMRALKTVPGDASRH